MDTKVYNLLQKITAVLQHSAVRGIYLCLVIFAGYAIAFPPTYQGIVPPPYIKEGKAGVSILHIPFKKNPVWEIFGNTSGSPLILYEDGNPLGSPNMLHESIRKDGNGAFSHWEKVLFFSASDSNDVATNGKVYSFETTLQPRVWVLALGVVGLGILLFPILLPIMLQYSILQNQACHSTHEKNYELYFPKIRSFSYYHFRMRHRCWWLRHISFIIRQHKANLFGIFLIRTGIWCLPALLLSVLAIVYLVTVFAAALAGYAQPAAAIFYHIPSLSSWLTFSFVRNTILVWLLLSLSLSWLMPASRAKKHALWLTTRILATCSLVIILAACLLILAFDQTGMLHGGLSIRGVFPYSDAHGYWNSATSFFTEGRWGTFATRRPLAAGLRQVSTITETYQGVLLVQVIVYAISAWCAVYAVGLWRGIWAAGIFAVCALSGTTVFLGSTLTETPAMWLALLAVPPCIYGLRSGNVLGFFLSFAMLCFALQARMGAMFMIPAFVCWLLWITKATKAQWKYILLASVCILILSVGVPHVLKELYGSPVQLGGNFSYSLCGMSIGGDWALPLTHYASELQGLTTEQEKNAFLYAKALENIKNTPSTFVVEIAKRAGIFVLNIQNLLSGYSLPDWPLLIKNWALGLLVLCIPAWWQMRTKGELTLYIFLFLGMFFSASIVMRDDGWRALMAGYPLLWMAFASLFVYPSSLRSTMQPCAPTHYGHQRFTKVALQSTAWGVLIVLCALIVPAYMAKSLPPIPQAIQQHYPNAQVVRAQGFAGILIVPDGAPLTPFVPSISASAWTEYFKKKYPYMNIPPIVWPNAPFVFGYFNCGALAVGPPDLLTTPIHTTSLWALTTEPWDTGKLKMYMTPLKRIIMAHPIPFNP